MLSSESGTHQYRAVVADSTGPNSSSYGGALLLRQTVSKLNFLPPLVACFTERRDQRHVHHSVEEMLAQRVYALALGKCLPFNDSTASKIACLAKDRPAGTGKGLGGEDIDWLVRNPG